MIIILQAQFDEFSAHSCLVIFSKGLIDIKVPENQPIDINSTAIITCTTPENLGEVKWFLTDTKNKTTQITKGKEAALSRTDRTDTVTLIGISGSWKGSFPHTVFTINT